MGTFSSIPTSYKGSEALARVTVRETEQKAHRQGQVRARTVTASEGAAAVGAYDLFHSTVTSFLCIWGCWALSGFPLPPPGQQACHLGHMGGQVRASVGLSIKVTQPASCTFNLHVQRRGCRDPGGRSVVRAPSHHILMIWVTNEGDRQEPLPLQGLTCHARDRK